MGVVDPTPRILHFLLRLSGSNPIFFNMVRAMLSYDLSAPSVATAQGPLWTLVCNNAERASDAPIVLLVVSDSNDKDGVTAKPDNETGCSVLVWDFFLSSNHSKENHV